MGHVIFFSFSYHKITSVETKYVIKLITLISTYHLKTSCELAGSFKIEMQMYKLLLVLTLFRFFSQLLLKEKFYGRFVYFEDTVTYSDKIIMGKQIGILKFIQL